MPSRYQNRRIIGNEDEMYDNLREDKNVKSIRQYSTPTLKYISPKQKKRIKTVSHVWTYGDKYYKLAIKYYGSADYWWIIAQYNYAPTEAHVKNGQILNIPVVIEQILRYIH